MIMNTYTIYRLATQVQKNRKLPEPRQSMVNLLMVSSLQLVISRIAGKYQVID